MPWRYRNRLWLLQSETLPTARDVAGATTGSDGRIYLIGGVDATAYSHTVESYDPATGTGVCSRGDSACPVARQTLKAMPTARYGASATVGPDHRTYVISGRTPTVVSTVEAHTVPASRPTVARVSWVAAIRHEPSVEIRCRLVKSRDVIGFLLYGGSQQLTSRAIRLHAAPTYRIRIQWSGAAWRLSLHLRTSNPKILYREDSSHEGNAPDERLSSPFLPPSR